MSDNGAQTRPGNGSKQFRHAYVVEGGPYDFTALKELACTIRFVTTGYENDNELIPAIRDGLKDYDPLLDILVPVGSVATNLAVGLVLGEIRYNHHIALYQSKQYKIIIAKMLDR